MKRLHCSIKIQREAILTSITSKLAVAHYPKISGEIPAQVAHIPQFTDTGVSEGY